jgi:hypothetical protein
MHPPPRNKKLFSTPEFTVRTRKRDGYVRRARWERTEDVLECNTGTMQAENRNKVRRCEGFASRIVGTVTEHWSVLVLPHAACWTVHGALRSHSAFTMRDRQPREGKVVFILLRNMQGSTSAVAFLLMAYWNCFVCPSVHRPVRI